MFRAPVPEAAIYEHSYAPGAEDDIRSGPKAADAEREVLPEPKPASVEFRT
jgi:hypothetical protein